MTEVEQVEEQDSSDEQGSAGAQARGSEPEAQQLSPEEVEDLQQRVASQNQRIDELSRAYAELINDRDAFRKRMEREKDRQVEAAKVEVAELLFDAMDDLRRALQSGATEGAAVAEGVRLIADGLQRRLEGMGATAIPTEGAIFDPIQHEAMDLVPTDDPEADGKVVDEARGGWKIGERVVRAARVRVARYVPPAQEAEASPESSSE